MRETPVQESGCKTRELEKKRPAERRRWWKVPLSEPAPPTVVWETVFIYLHQELKKPLMLSGDGGSGWLHKNARQQKSYFFPPPFIFFFEGTGCARGRSLILWRRSFTAWRDRTESFATRRNRWSEKSSTSKIY